MPYLPFLVVHRSLSVPAELQDSCIGQDNLQYILSEIAQQYKIGIRFLLTPCVRTGLAVAMAASQKVTNREITT